MKIAMRIVAAVLMLALLAVLVPSAMPVAGAEDLPQWEEVTLAAETVEPIPYEEKAPYAPHADGWLPDEAGYLDDSISVRIYETRRYNTRILVTFITVADASQLRTATAKKYPSKALKDANEIGGRERAVLTINGDYFMDRKEGYIVRNGVELRPNYSDYLDALIIDTDGDFHILTKPSRGDIDAYQGRIAHSFAFGPGLVIDGVKTEEFNNKMMAPNKRAQRCIICQMGPLSYAVVTTEGPDQKNSTGLTLPEAAELVYDLGVKQAYNLDGGSSTWLVLNGQKLNARGARRGIADVIYFVTAVGE